MQAKDDDAWRTPMIRLLNVAFEQFAEELGRRVTAAGFGDIRPGHGCVFGTIDPVHGSRLTELAERANMTKQSVGEVTSDLEERGYVERIADPLDGRAKIIRLTPHGRHAYRVGRELIDELEDEWAQRFGTEQIEALRASLEAVTAERLEQWQPSLMSSGQPADERPDQPRRSATA
jgi:DNA-binding MarR family transcriptional regulator